MAVWYLLYPNVHVYATNELTEAHMAVFSSSRPHTARAFTQAGIQFSGLFHLTFPKLLHGTQQAEANPVGTSQEHQLS